MRMFNVKFREPRVVDTSETWWPHGEEPSCVEAYAWTRFAWLLELSLAGAKIEGAHIANVRIEDAETEEVLLSIVPLEGLFEGPWAERCSPIEASDDVVLAPMPFSIFNMGKSTAHSMAN